MTLLIFWGWALPFMGQVMAATYEPDCFSTCFATRKAVHCLKGVASVCKDTTPCENRSGNPFAHNRYQILHAATCRKVQPPLCRASARVH